MQDNISILEPKDAVIERLADLIERRDNTTGGHIHRIVEFMKLLIEAVVSSGFYREETASWNIDQLVLSVYLHDVGKIEIDELILRKSGKLSLVEYEVMKRHTLLGGEIINEIKNNTAKSEFLEDAYLIAMYHHEKWDGTGYPKGLKGKEIPLIARLMSIIDVYDALVAERPYKKPFSHEEAVKIILDAMGTSFDPALSGPFISIADKLNEIKIRIDEENLQSLS